MFELCRYRVANLTCCSEFMSETETVVKNRIEFQWGSKMQGTSSEALVRSWKYWFYDGVKQSRKYLMFPIVFSIFQLLISLEPIDPISMEFSVKCSCENGANSKLEKWKLNLTDFRLILLDHSTFDTFWIYWSPLNTQVLWGFSISECKGNSTHVSTEMLTLAPRLSHPRNVPAAFVLRSASGMLFYINS